VSAAPGLDPLLDLVVIAAGTPDESGSDVGWELWEDVQQDYADLVPGSRHVVVEDSDHLIPTNRPDAIVDEIAELLDNANTDTEAS